jgi:hypothetical protein
MAGGFVGAENPVRFLDAFVGMLCCRDNINNDRGLFCRDDLVHRKSAMQRFGCNYLQNKGLEKVRTEWRFTPKAFGADNPGLQPQTIPLCGMVSFEKLMLAVGVKVPQSA